MLLAKMNPVETANQVATALQALLPLVARVLTLASKAKRLIGPAVSYENLLLDVTLDLHDRSGRRATVICKQKVRFLVQDEAIVSSPVWGDGNQLASCSVTGARRLAERQDGPRRVQLLALDRNSHTPRQAHLVMRREVRDGFTSADEYFESTVQRPTARLNLTVLFPRSRPPRGNHIVSSTGEKISPPRLRLSDGRAGLRWSLQSPRLGSVYSLRWAW